MAILADNDRRHVNNQANWNEAMADPSAPRKRRLPARIIVQGEPLVAFTETGDGRLAIRRHVHNNGLLGSALTQTRALGGNGQSLCLSPPFLTSDDLLPSML